jgi:hypothetical protein
MILYFNQVYLYIISLLFPEIECIGINYMTSLSGYYFLIDRIAIEKKGD